MKILTIAYYTIIKNFRDKRSISLTLLFPIMLILILGTALNSVYSPVKLSNIQVAYLNEDKGEASRQFDVFLQSDNIKKLLSVTKVNTYEEGMDQIKNNKTGSFIYIDGNYTRDARLDKKSIIKVYQSNGSSLNASIVKNIVDSYSNGANTIMTLNKMGYQTFNYNTYKNIDEKTITTNGTMPRAIDYYAVTMLALTLMYGALYASFGMAEDRTEKTYIRIKSAPIKSYVNYLGKTLGTIVTLILQAILLILFTKYAFHVNWGSNLPMIIILSALMSILVTSLGIMAYAITNNAMRASGIINILVVFFTFISGGYAKINAAGTWFETFSYISPNKVFQTAVFNTVYNGQAGQTELCIAAMIGLAAVMFLISTVLGRREFN